MKTELDFISPSNPNFIFKIEAGISRLVQICRSRGLRTVSSCEGHPHNRHVTLAFKGEKEVLRFKEIIPDYRITSDSSESDDDFKDYTFLTVWIDAPDTEIKTVELEQRVAELYG